MERFNSIMEMTMKIAGVLALAIVVTSLLTGCSTMSNLEQAQAREVYNRCPPLKRYTKQQLSMAAKEYDALPDTSYLAVLVTDYGKLRKACRAADNYLKTMPK